MKKKFNPITIFLLYMIFPYLIIIPLEILKIASPNIKVIYFFISDLIFILFLIYYYRESLKRDLKDYKKNYKNYIDEGIKYWIIGLIIMVVTNTLITVITNNDMAKNETAVRDLLEQVPMYMIFATVIFAPIVEELIFRKTFKDIFKSKWLFIIMSGLVFGGLHVISDFNNYYELLYIIPYGALGSAFAYLYYKTNNIYNSMIMHAIHNGSLVLLFFLGN